ncbi:hypothetical protein ACFL6M_02820 [Candidatus Eisenbacteria bacterium]|uniref:Uncharacterized protein n=1 Tax=Eiseniibacteriota bacterium TaxID=2212470 RepID=A0ABV6YJK8_UNCEI
MGLILALVLVPSVADAQIMVRVFGSVSFPDVDPDLRPQLGPESILIWVRVMGSWGSPWVLTLTADSDLLSGPDVIPASSISWTAMPSPPFRGGVLSTTMPVVVASGVSPMSRIARFSFYLQNSWSYNVGNYSGTATYTLSSP